MKPSDIALFGYLAVIQRIAVAHIPTAPCEGTTGQMMAPTLTCDAALIAFRLAHKQFSLQAAFSHPGSGVAASSALVLLKKRIPQVRLGPYCGTPFEMLATSQTGALNWYSDPQFGLKSLDRVDARHQPTRWLYVDGFDWLQSMQRMNSAPIPSEGLCVNLGYRTPSGLLDICTEWRSTCAKTLALQISLGPLDQSHALTLAREIMTAGINVLVLTLGRKGLVLASKDGMLFQPPQPLPQAMRDASGAGAAVSSCLLEALASESKLQLSQLAKAMSQAGADQCVISCALDVVSMEQWHSLMAQSKQDKGVEP